MQRLLTTFVLSLIVVPSFAIAQDEKKAADKPAAEKKPAAEAAADDFASVFTAFRKLEDELNDIAKKYSNAPADEREAQMKHYQEHVVEIRGMLPKLRKAAIADYKAKPNENKDATQTLVGLLANHVRNDEYKQGLEIAEMLIKNKCEVKDVHNFAGIAFYSTEQFEKAKTHLAAAQEAKAIDRNGSQILASIVNRLWG